KKRDWHATVLQRGKVPFDRQLSAGIRLLSWKRLSEVPELLNHLQGNRRGLTIYSDHYCVPASLVHPCIMISHGVDWDQARTRLSNPSLVAINKLRKRWNRWRLF